jgi:general secretion pathway protein E
MIDSLLPEIDESDIPDSPPATLLLQLSFMKRFLVLPIDDSEKDLVVIMADPQDFNSREVLRTAYSKSLKIFRGEPELIKQVIYRWYEADADRGDQGGDGGIDLADGDQLWDDPEQLRDMASEAPVIRLVNHLISRALEMGASDIHVEPRKSQVLVRYRVDGVLHDQETITNRLKAAITSRVKLMAKMDIAERRLPQDGRMKVKIGKYEIDMRVSTIPVHYGESLVLRLLQQENIQYKLAGLGFSEAFADQFRKNIFMPYGIFLVTGPTGSGKTTTLYNALGEINSPDKKIVTVEDPVEYQLEGVNQVQVKTAIGLTYANVLRSFLRHDPDVMLVGEIRDSETADIAVQASLTGHMVFSTLHTNDAVGAITRLEDMGVESYLISSCLVGVLAQRLVRKICPSCMCEETMPDQQMKSIAQSLDLPLERMERKIRYGKGCEECGHTGYKGRAGIFELMTLNDEIQSLVARGAERKLILEKAIENGMKTLREDGLDKVLQGVTTYEELLRVTR